MTDANLRRLCTQPFLRWEKHAYCSTDLVLLERFARVLHTDLCEELGRIFLRMMKMLHLCDYQMSDLVCVLAHTSAYYERMNAVGNNSNNDTDKDGKDENARKGLSPAPGSGGHREPAPAAEVASSFVATSNMGRLERANIVVILCFVAHSYVLDECCPLCLSAAT